MHNLGTGECRYSAVNYRLENTQPRRPTSLLPCASSAVRMEEHGNLRESTRSSSSLSHRKSYFRGDKKDAEYVRICNRKSRISGRYTASSASLSSQECSEMGVSSGLTERSLLVSISTIQGNIRVRLTVRLNADISKHFSTALPAFSEFYPR
ncbi:unnamed protein product, partial [Heterotrigona itama]